VTLELLLGIDAGTSVLKAALFDADKCVHAVAARRTELSTPRTGGLVGDAALHHMERRRQGGA
jgi:sugar (pentulose or hexulose) kinase